MVSNKFSLHRMALVALFVELLTTSSFPMLAQGRSLNQEELAAWKISTPATHFPEHEVEKSPTLHAQSIRFPTTGTPRRRRSAATRGGAVEARVPKSCGNSSDEQMVALLPPTEPVRTVSEHPTILVSLPENTAKEAEFYLKEAGKDDIIYETTVTLPGDSGIVSVPLPDDGTLPALEVGKMYTWHFFVICQDMTNEPYVEGQIERVEPSPNLVAELENASPRDRAAIYAKAGIWYDCLNSLAQLYRSAPNDSAIASDWADLLESVGLDTISQKPLISAITPVQ
ncbi:MAG: DUF928 domain-containing protein [Coleofasciculus chthonoplastes F3-SA18-01]|uniref:DUF928 domain-containing protein n=1 Tax=Coleofasciculus chthonoplastes TaxID=64178 RepID=UPI0033034452